MITHLLMVEGEDDKKFFEELIKFLKAQSSAMVYSVGGKGNFKKYQKVKDVMRLSAHENLQSVMLIGDADEDFQSCQNSFAELTKKIRQDFSYIQETHCYILPDNQNSGMMETFLLEILEEKSDDKFIDCVKKFGSCVGKIKGYNQHYLPKLKVLSYLYAATAGNRGIANHIDSVRENSKKSLFIDFTSSNPSLTKLKEAIKQFLNP